MLRFRMIVVMASLWAGTLQAQDSAGLPIGLGYEINARDVEIGENIKENEYGSFKFKVNYHTISLLDYTGIACAGMQNTGRMMEAREKALDGARYNEQARRTGYVSYSYEVATPQSGAACGVSFHMARSSDKAEIGGRTIANRSRGEATISGWSAFGIVGSPFDSDPRMFWRVLLYADLRTITIKGVPPDVTYMPYYDFKEMVLTMPFDYEIGRTFEIPNVGGFMAWASVGYEMVFWLLKAMLPSNFPTSFLRYGAGIGYQTPIEKLQVRLGYKNTDSAVDGRGLKEKGYTLGVYYQM